MEVRRLRTMALEILKSLKDLNQSFMKKKLTKETI